MLKAKVPVIRLFSAYCYHYPCLCPPDLELSRPVVEVGMSWDVEPRRYCSELRNGHLNSALSSGSLQIPTCLLCFWMLAVRLARER